jgi:hypothetical protein
MSDDIVFAALCAGMPSSALKGFLCMTGERKSDDIIFAALCAGMPSSALKGFLCMAGERKNER